MARTLAITPRLEARLAAFKSATIARRAAAERVQALHNAGQSTEDAFRAYLQAERDEDRCAHDVAISVEHRVDELGDQQKGAA